MKCNKCNTEVEVIGRTTLCYRPIDKSLIAEYNFPFYCDLCCAIKSPAKPLRDLVFVYQDEPEEKYGKGIIEIPKQYQSFYEKDTGIILAIGPGYYKKSGQFVPTTAKIGQKIRFNKQVPFNVELEDTRGIKRRIKVIGEKDILYIMEND